MTLLSAVNIWSNGDCDLFLILEVHEKPFHLLFSFLFWHLICSWPLHFYDHCLWSSMTHINRRASFLGSGFLSLMFAYYWTGLLLKTVSLSLFKSLGNSSSEFVENINHISLDSFSKPAWDNDAFRVFSLAGRHISLKISLDCVRKFGLLVFPCSKLLKTCQSLMTITYLQFVPYTSSSGESFKVHPRLPPLPFCPGCSFVQVSCSSVQNCWRKSKH